MATTPASTTVAPTTEALPTTTAPPTIGPAAYATAGPYPVGVTTLTLPTGVAVEVWYPTTAEPTGVIGYDVRDYVPPDVRALLSQDVEAGYWFPGSRDTPVADGRFPLVVFSHGYSGIRVQSSFLTGHLASWGMIVAAPEHASRDLTNVLAQTASGNDDEAVADVLQTLDLITAEDVTAGGRFEGRVDLDHVALVGHSAGGRTILGAGLDTRVDGYVSMASGGPADGAAYPATPSLFLAGTLDGVVPVGDRHPAGPRRRAVTVVVPGARRHGPQRLRRGQQHLPHAHTGEAAGDRVVADGIDRPTEPRRSQPEHEHRPRPPPRR